MGHYTSETIRSLVELERFGPEWELLYDTSLPDNAFLAFEWVRLWWKHFGTSKENDRRELYIIVIRCRRDAHAILPLMRRVRSIAGIQIRKLEFIGQGMPDYAGFLLRDHSEATLAAVAGALADRSEEWEVVDLADCSWEAATMHALAKACRERGLKHRAAIQSRCPFLPIESDAEGLIQALPKNYRYTLRNRAKRFRKHEAAGITVRIIEHPEREMEILEKAAAVERLRKSSDAHVLNRSYDFWRDVFTRLGPRHLLFVAVMENRARLLAYQFGFRVGKKLWYYQAGFDPEFSIYSPGSMLILSIIDYGFRHGYTEYDFLRGEEPYKLKWTRHVHETTRMLVWSSRPGSRAAGALFRMRLSWKGTA